MRVRYVLVAVLALVVIGSKTVQAEEVSLQEDFDGLAPLLQAALDESIPGDVRGWTHSTPSGWTIDNSGMPPVTGTREWQGWSFTTMEFWTAADQQERGNFTFSEDVFAVADPDEWDDTHGAASSGNFNSILLSPPIPVSTGRTTYLRFHSHYRQENNQKAEVRVSWDGGPDKVLLRYSSSAADDNRGGDAQNRQVVLEIPPPEQSASMVLKWALFDAGNNWFWAIDNIQVNEQEPEPPPPPPPLPDVKDWPTYMHDNLRSGITPDSLNLLEMERLWVATKALPPRPAWPGPAKMDAWASVFNLKSMRNYDPVYHVIVVDGFLYFGSSSEDCVRCLDAGKGTEKWVFFADGPVRLAPTWDDGKVYFGSDDGHAYCVNAATGKLEWKYKASVDERLVPNDGKLISMLPVRSGVLVQDGKAYFSASLVPWERSYFFSVDAGTGSDNGPGLFKVQRSGSVTMEGALLATPTRLYVPQGRRAPMVFDRSSGSYIGAMSGGGGVYCLLTTDSQFVHGRGNKDGWLQESDAITRDIIATVNKGNLMIVDGDTAYIQVAASLQALERSTRRVLWNVPCPYQCALIKAGDHLVMGGVDEVAALDASSGETLWSESVDGRAYGLAVVDGTLYVSTDTGKIYGFSGQPPVGGLQRPGDFNQDGGIDISDPISLLLHLFSGVTLALPCDGDTLAEGGNLTLMDLNDDSRADISDALYALHFFFLAGPPPSLGTDCVRIEGCPDVCVR